MARDETKYEYWRNQIKRWEASGLTQMAYCRQEQLKASTFCYWLSELRKEQISAASLAPLPHPALTLIPARIKKEHPVTAAHTDWILRSPSGWEIRRPGDAGMSWIISLLKALA